jgi:hypothetical protein
LWDTIKQRHLGADKSIKEVIETYEIDEMTVAKVRAIYHAYKELDIQVDEGGELQAKVNLVYNIDLPPDSFIPSVNIGSESINLWNDSQESYAFPLTVNGFYDRKYPDYFCEDKLSGRPEYYLDPFYVQSQCGTYFLGDPELKYVIMEVVKFPQQKPSKKKEESSDEIYKRVYSDILSRPGNYFIGYDREKNRYGKKFFRGEFDLQAIEERYKQVTIEIMAARWSGNFYKNFKNCGNNYGSNCEYMTICKTGNVSENMYKIREGGV